jgi:hypothetical protein
MVSSRNVAKGLSIVCGPYSDVGKRQGALGWRFFLRGFDIGDGLLWTARLSESPEAPHCGGVNRGKSPTSGLLAWNTSGFLIARLELPGEIGIALGSFWEYVGYRLKRFPH